MNFETDQRAVSPVVGVALLIAIAVILAAVIGAVVLGLGTGGADTPQAQLQAQFTVDADADDNTVTIQHNGGEPLDADEIVLAFSSENDNNASVAGDMDLEDLTAGNSWEIEVNDEFDEFGESDNVDDDDEVEEVTITWEDPNSETEYVLETFEN